MLLTLLCHIRHSFIHFFLPFFSLLSFLSFFAFFHPFFLSFFLSSFLRKSTSYTNCSFFLSLYIYIPHPLSLSMYVYISFSLSLSLHLSIYVYFTLSIYLYLTLSIYAYLTLSIHLSLSLSPRIWFTGMDSEHALYHAGQHWNARACSYEWRILISFPIFLFLLSTLISFHDLDPGPLEWITYLKCTLLNTGIAPHRWTQAIHKIKLQRNIKGICWSLICFVLFETFPWWTYARILI